MDKKYERRRSTFMWRILITLDRQDALNRDGGTEVTSDVKHFAQIFGRAVEYVCVCKR